MDFTARPFFDLEVEKIGKEIQFLSSRIHWTEKVGLRSSQEPRPIDVPRSIKHTVYSIETIVVQATASAIHLANIWNAKWKLVIYTTWLIMLVILIAKLNILKWVVTLVGQPIILIYYIRRQLLKRTRQIDLK